MKNPEYVSFDSLVSGKSIKDLILLKDGQLDLSRFDALMRAILEESAKTSNVPSHKLVRVIRDNRVIWTTAEQAKKMVDYHRHHSLSDDSEAIANKIELAISGDISHLEDEMLILLCMAESTYKDNQEVLQKLERRRKDVLNVTTEIREGEMELAQRKRKTGIVDTFEEKMGLMLQARDRGQEKRANDLAAELRLIKSKYLLFARGLEPQIQKIRQLRGELVRTKEKVLIHIKNSVTQEEKSLSLSIDSLEKNMKSLEDSFNKIAHSSGTDSKDLDSMKTRIAKVQSAIKSKTERIESIQQEKAALNQEIETAKVVADKLGAPSLDDSINEQVKKQQGKIKETPGLDAIVNKSSTSRMHINR